MPQRNPEEKAANVTPATPDRPAGQPTGGEVNRPAQADRPKRATGGDSAAAQSEADVLEQAQNIAAEYYDRLAEITSDFADQARSYMEQSRRFVGEHPASTVGGGFALGLLIGFLIGRD